MDGVKDTLADIQGGRGEVEQNGTRYALIKYVKEREDDDGKDTGDETV